MSFGIVKRYSSIRSCWTFAESTAYQFGVVCSRGQSLTLPLQSRRLANVSCRFVSRKVRWPAVVEYGGGICAGPNRKIWIFRERRGFHNIAIAIVELPGKIVNAIIDGLKSLFVPSEEDLAAIQEQYKTLLSERLGFVWQAGELVIDFGSSVLSALEGATDYSFHFPGVHLSLPEGEYDLIAAQDVSLDNPLTAVLRPVLGTIVSFLVVAAFVNTAERMVVAFVSGKSYFDFLKGDGEE